MRYVFENCRIKSFATDWHKTLSWLIMVVGLLCWSYTEVHSNMLTIPELRQTARKTYDNGNYKEALTLYRQLLNRTDNAPDQVGNDLDIAVACLNNLSQQKKTDQLRETVIKKHQNNWQLLWAAARSYQYANHSGYMIAGEFERGHHRGGGKYMNSLDRDRVRALQLMVQAMKTEGFQENKTGAGNFFHSFAQMWLQNRYNQQASWELGALTDITKLPDYEEGYSYWNEQTRGASVDKYGKPVFFKIPVSFEESDNDGERWRWCLMMAKKMNPPLEHSVRWSLANFLHQQFGVQTMTSYRWHQPREEEGDESGTYAVHTLGDEESVAKLATGIKRFSLPDEYNYIKIYKALAGEKGYYQANALQKLAGIYANRRMYVKAAKYWHQVTDLPNQSEHTYNTAKKQLSQIRDNWGQFEPVMTQPYGKNAIAEFRFRNAEKADFQAYAIKIPKLLSDVKAYIKKRPRKLDWQKTNISSIGWRLLEKDGKKYLGNKVSEWSVKLTPGKNHWDRRVTVKTPLNKAGAYLLEAELPGGHKSRIVIWLNNTVIVHKPLDKKSMYYVADAVTGKPLPHVKLDFFGYHHRHIRRNLYRTDIKSFAEYSDSNGLVYPDPKDLSRKFSWLITAEGENGRFAYLGFNNVWYGHWYDQQYNQTKVFTITDRPVYRPGQVLKFKQWIRQAKYDQEDKSFFANQSVSVEITDPKGDRIYEKSLTTDEFGGLNDEFQIPADATLGVYRIYNKSHSSGETFRVEEYKKPEFEVTVDAPEKPVMLGEKITAEIKARYYFGEPVKKGRVKYKVLRYNHSAQWFPIGTWDWFYGPGYWWFAYDCTWYPGWLKWGCPRPRPWWVHRPGTPPEVVAEHETEIPENGIIKVDIDTRLAKEIHGDKDHRYEITAEVTDLSRRTVVGKGTVLAARYPFKVYAWVNSGHFRVGDTVHAEFSARTLDKNPVQGRGELTLYKISYDKDMQPIETAVQKWYPDTDAQGRSEQRIRASEPGQYRLSYLLTDEKGHKIEGGYVFTVMGEGMGEGSDKNKFRFDNIELVTDKREYHPGEKVRLRINTNQAESVVVLFTRPSDGVYLPPKILYVKNKSIIEEISITQKDMPNFFIEAFTISDGKLYSTTREVIVPPEKRILNLEVEPSAEEYKPGEKATLGIKLKHANGEPFEGSAVITVYDKALEYISGGTNVSDIKSFFWKWRRRHHETAYSNLMRTFRNLIRSKEQAMQDLGAFGHMVADMNRPVGNARGFKSKGGFRLSERKNRMSASRPMGAVAEMKTEMVAEAEAPMADKYAKADFAGGRQGVSEEIIQPAIRTKFADTAFWAANVKTDSKGSAQVSLTMPDNLTGWKVKTWAMGHGTKVGEAETLITTKKNLMIRLQAPRFLIEKDEVVISGNVHNYLDKTKKIKVLIELEGGCLKLMPSSPESSVLPLPTQNIEIRSGGEMRADWRVQVLKQGTAIIRMKALTNEESDAMEMQFPVYVHGAEKIQAWSGYIRPDGMSETIHIDVPKERRTDSARLTVRYSPTLAGAMVDALPYLADYPYGCTEQTLNRFLPAVITQKILMNMGLDLKEIEKKQASLNAQELGDPKERAAQWKKNETTYDENGSLIKKNPVFDESEVRRMVKVGVQALAEMQLQDGGWGWFSGYGEQSWAHTTAYVVHGLQMARENDVALVSGVLERGTEWLKKYENKQVALLRQWDEDKNKGKSRADNMDAFVYMVLADAHPENKAMGKYLYRDRNHLTVYAKSMAAMGFHVNGHHEKRNMIMKNIEQYLIRDDENQTAYLNLGNSGYWWHWYGSEYEAHAYYLKLLARTGAVHDWKAPYLVKYLLNNRKHATYWKSTRDTAIVIEAFADYLKATGEHKPDLTLEILVDNIRMKEVRITAENLFQSDNRFVLSGNSVKGGRHSVEIRKKGRGPLYFNAYLSYFSLENFITKAGLEVKVQRRVFKLNPVDKTIKVAGSHGQAADQKVEKYERELLDNEAMVKSGDLLETELVIESKNDYEYLVFEDFKGAGFEPVDVRSGYTGNDMGAYAEFRDNRVVFFVRQLARGRHSVSYRLRAEIPGRFSALPARGYAMYAPELRGNSDEIKLRISD